MTSIPPTMAAEMALTKQNVALSVIKQNAEQQKAMVSILDQSLEASNDPLSQGVRGTNVNISV